jgi:hypothetical protein
MKKNKSIELNQRAERIQTAIAHLNQKIAQIASEGEVAPPGCQVTRYQARGSRYRYWYYQLKASDPIFPKANQSTESSRFQHLGSSGSEAHINGVLAVARRIQIDELTKIIDNLKQSWLDLYSDSQNVGHRVE